MTYETIRVEKTHDGRVATVTVSRPDALNALNRTVLEELYAAATSLAVASPPTGTKICEARKR